MKAQLSERPALSRLFWITAFTAGLIAAVTIYFPSSGRASESQDCLFELSHLSSEKSGDPRRSYVEDLLTRRQLQAAKTAAFLRENSLGQKFPRRDFVVVGGGLHGLAFTELIEQGNPRLKGLVIDSDAGDSAIWDRAGDSYLIGPAEFHRIPGAAVQPGDFFKKGSPRLLGYTLGEAIQFLASQIRAEQILSDPVVGVDSLPGGGERVRTRSGIKIDTDAVVLSLGLRIPKFDVGDQETRELVKRVSTSDAPDGGVPDIQYNLRAWTRGAEAIRRGEDPLAPYKGKRVAVIGGGGGGKNEVKRLLGIQKMSLPPEMRDALHPNSEGPSVVHWFGVPKAEMELVDRTLGPLLHTGRLHYNDVLVNRIRERVGPSGMKEYVIESQASDGTMTQTVVDKILLATGYEEPLPPLPAWMADKEGRFPPLDDIVVNVAGLGPVVVAKRVRNRKIFLIGAGAGLDIPLSERARTFTQSPISLQVLGPRTAAAAEVFVHEQIENDKKEIRPLPSGPDPFAMIQLPFPADLSGIHVGNQETNLLRLRTALARELGRFRYTGQIQLQLLFRRSPEGLSLVVYGYAKNEALKIRDVLIGNPELVTAVGELLLDGENSVEVYLKVRPDGRPLPEDLLVFSTP